MRESELRFIREQGFSDPHPDRQLYVALMLQPRLVGVLVVLGIVLQSAWLFLTVSAMLAWSALVPALNPFDAIYNHVVAYRRGREPLGVAPAPRRFAAGLAGTHALVIGLAMLAGATRTAWLAQGLLMAAVAAVVFARACAGSRLYFVLRRALVSRPGVAGRLSAKV